MVGKWLRTQTRTLSLKHYRIVLIIYTIPAKKEKEEVNMPQGPLHHVKLRGKTRAVDDDPIRKPAGAVTFSQHDTFATCVQGRFERGVLALLMNVV